MRPKTGLALTTTLAGMNITCAIVAALDGQRIFSLAALVLVFLCFWASEYYWRRLP